MNGGEEFDAVDMNELGVWIDVDELSRAELRSIAYIHTYL